MRNPSAEEASGRGCSNNMAQPVSYQLAVSLYSMALGVGFGLYYDFIKALRIRTRAFWLLFLCDVIFWVPVGLALFTFGMSEGRGELRIYMLAFVCLGAVIYAYTLSRFWLRLCTLLTRGLSKLLTLCLYPFKTTAKMIIFCIKKLFSFSKKWFTIILSKFFRLGIFHPTRPDETEAFSHEAQKDGHFYENSDNCH